MNCQRCKSDRILNISGKCSDLCSYSLKGQEPSRNYQYVPNDMNVGEGDYIVVNICLECGQTQGKYPLPETKFELEIKERLCDPFKKDDLVEFDIRDDLVVGFVTEYNRETLEVTIEIYGLWDKERNKLGPMPHRSGPRPNSKIYTLFEEDVKRSTKDF